MVEEAKTRGRSVSFGETAEEALEVLEDVGRFNPSKKERIQSQMSQISQTLSDSNESLGNPLTPTKVLLFHLEPIIQLDSNKRARILSSAKWRDTGR